ncbi:CRAL-TRIO domain-containing protein [Paraphysoderma sedebokerense]|nr:CRAL-TRIO domain-containing protein [Paraphysoderma sedebokerense]
MVSIESVHPTYGRRGHLTPEEAKALAEMWAALIDFWYSNPNAPVDINTVESKYSGVEIENGQLIIPHDISRDTAPPVISTKTPSVITRAFLRQSFWLYSGPYHPTDLLLRYLRARKFDVRAAFNMLLETSLWRSKSHLQLIIEKGERAIAKNLLASGEAFYYKVDKLGRPVIYINVKNHLRSVNTQEELERFLKYQIEIGVIILKRPADAATLVFNMNGMSINNMDISFVKYLSATMQAYYPESLGAALVVDAPWLFNGFWKVIQGFLDPKVQQKVHFIKLSQLKNFIHEHDIPQDLGGTDPIEFNYIPPTSSDLKWKVNKAEKKRLLLERMEQVVPMEQHMKELAIRMHASGQEGYEAKREQELTEKLMANFWDFDEVTRCPTFYHRMGAIEKDVCDWGKFQLK